MTSEIFFYALIAIVAFFYLRRAFLGFTITHYAPAAAADKEIICYCRSENRSLSAAAKLRKAGFTAANLKGGINEWNFQNLGS